MIRTKLGLLGLCAVVLGMMAMSASSAQAALSWLILNSAKTTATELKALLVGKKDSAHLSLHGEVGGFKIVVTCGTFTLNGVSLETGGKLTEGGKVVFGECGVYKTAPLTGDYMPKCSVKSPGAATGTVETNEGKGELVLHTFATHEPGKVELKEVLTKIEPKAGPTGNFATLRFEGAECVLPEGNQVHGTLFAQVWEALVKEKKKPLPCDKNATKHQLEHLIVEGPLTALYVGGHSAKQLEVTKILGSAWILLAGAHKDLHWAAMDA